MRALLDVNVLIALFDRRHTHRPRARSWWTNERERGWATCPTTENGVARILSQPKYPGSYTPVLVVGMLHQLAANSNHIFWPDDVSITDTASIDPARILGPKQISDVYLLALAVRHGGRLVTFDKTIPTGAVTGAKPEHLVVL